VQAAGLKAFPRKLLGDTTRPVEGMLEVQLVDPPHQA
jgi:hypothetical protein